MSSPFQDKPILSEDVTLTGEVVRLRPLFRRDIPALTKIGLDPELWTWTPRAIDTPRKMAQYVEEAVRGRDDGRYVPFVIEERSTGRVAGCTRYGNIALSHRRLEIGWTWVAKEWQGTAVNSESKLLLLSHAFEDLGCRRVEMKTDSENKLSRHAMLAIGCTEEGTLRNHMITESGRVRHTVYFSIIDREWPGVKARLAARVARKRGSSN